MVALVSFTSPRIDVELGTYCTLTIRTIVSEVPQYYGLSFHFPPHCASICIASWIAKDVGACWWFSLMKRIGRCDFRRTAVDYSTCVLCGIARSVPAFISSLLISNFCLFIVMLLGLSSHSFPFFLTYVLWDEHVTFWYCNIIIWYELVIFWHCNTIQRDECVLIRLFSITPSDKHVVYSHCTIILSAEHVELFWNDTFILWDEHKKF